MFSGFYIQQWSYYVFKAIKMHGKFCTPLKTVLGCLSYNYVKKKHVLKSWNNQQYIFGNKIKPALFFHSWALFSFCYWWWRLVAFSRKGNAICIIPISSSLRKYILIIILWWVSLWLIIFILSSRCCGSPGKSIMRFRNYRCTICL